MFKKVLSALVILLVMNFFIGCMYVQHDELLDDTSLEKTDTSSPTGSKNEDNASTGTEDQGGEEDKDSEGTEDSKEPEEKDPVGNDNPEETKSTGSIVYTNDDNTITVDKITIKDSEGKVTTIVSAPYTKEDLTEGSYTVEVTYTSNGTTNTVSTTVEVTKGETTNVTTSDFGSAVVHYGKINADLSDLTDSSTTVNTITIKDSNGTVISTGNGDTLIASGLTEGSYTVEVTYTSNGTTNTVSTEVTVKENETTNVTTSDFGSAVVHYGKVTISLSNSDSIEITSCTMKANDEVYTALGNTPLTVTGLTKGNSYPVTVVYTSNGYSHSLSTAVEVTEDGEVLNLTSKDFTLTQYGSITLTVEDKTALPYIEHLKLYGILDAREELDLSSGSITFTDIPYGTYGESDNKISYQMFGTAYEINYTPVTLNSASCTTSCVIDHWFIYVQDSNLGEGEGIYVCTTDNSANNGWKPYNVIVDGWKLLDCTPYKEAMNGKSIVMRVSCNASDHKLTEGWGDGKGHNVPYVGGVEFYYVHSTSNQTSSGGTFSLGPTN